MVGVGHKRKPAHELLDAFISCLIDAEKVGVVDEEHKDEHVDEHCGQGV